MLVSALFNLQSIANSLRRGADLNTTARNFMVMLRTPPHTPLQNDNFDAVDLV
jgi:hypothetical protein